MQEEEERILHGGRDGPYPATEPPRQAVARTVWIAFHRPERCVRRSAASQGEGRRLCQETERGRRLARRKPGTPRNAAEPVDGPARQRIGRVESGVDNARRWSPP